MLQIQIRIREGKAGSESALKRAKLDLDPKNSGAFEAQNGAMKGRGRSRWRLGGSKRSNGGSVDKWSQICINLLVIRIRISNH